MVYEWDSGKAAGNLKKHRVTFTEAATVFLDPLAVTYEDPDHSEGEQRHVAHLDRGDRIRIISARKATRKEAHEFRETS